MSTINSTTVKQSSTEQALDILGQLQRSWLTTMDETLDRGCYEPGSDEETHIQALADASYRVAHVFDSARDALMSKYIPF